MRDIPQIVFINKMIRKQALRTGWDKSTQSYLPSFPLPLNHLALMSPLQTSSLYTVQCTHHLSSFLYTEQCTHHLYSSLYTVQCTHHLSSSFIAGYVICRDLLKYRPKTCIFYSVSRFGLVWFGLGGGGGTVGYQGPLLGPG